MCEVWCGYARRWPDLPTVLTLGVDFAKPGLPLADQGRLGRAELLSTSFMEYEKRIREQMMEMFGASGFDAKRILRESF